MAKLQSFNFFVKQIFISRDREPRVVLGGLREDATAPSSIWVRAFATDAFAERLLVGLRQNLLKSGEDFDRGVAIDVARQGLTMRLSGHFRFRGKHMVGKRERAKFELEISTYEILPPVAAPDGAAEFHDFVYDATWMAVQRSDGHKSSEGATSIAHSWSADPTQEQPSAMTEVYAYVLGPSRNHDWRAETIDEAIAQARQSITGWLMEDSMRLLMNDDDNRVAEHLAPLAETDKGTLFLLQRHGFADGEIDEIYRATETLYRRAIAGDHDASGHAVLETPAVAGTPLQVSDLERDFQRFVADLVAFAAGRAGDTEPDPDGEAGDPRPGEMPSGELLVGWAWSNVFDADQRCRRMVCLDFPVLDGKLAYPTYFDGQTLEEVIAGARRALAAAIVKEVVNALETATTKDTIGVDDVIATDKEAMAFLARHYGETWRGLVVEVIGEIAAERARLERRLQRRKAA